VACRDPTDDKFLELAVSGKADLILSGDKDLLTLHPFRSIPIVAPATFVLGSCPWPCKWRSIVQPSAAACCRDRASYFPGSDIAQDFYKCPWINVKSIGRCFAAPQWRGSCAARMP
ncbi:MAG TPA: putative toxin-antitoxin system toxin component, PIN family, partial [Acetobacteraceae bacterium]